MEIFFLKYFWDIIYYEYTNFIARQMIAFQRILRSSRVKKKSILIKWDFSFIKGMQNTGKLPNLVFTKFIVKVLGRTIFLKNFNRCDKKKISSTGFRPFICTFFQEINIPTIILQDLFIISK